MPLKRYAYGSGRHGGLFESGELGQYLGSLRGVSTYMPSQKSF
jgi:hypothetical protein